MATVAQILQQSGFSDSEIAKLDQRAITAFSGMLTEAERAKEQAELQGRANSEFYESKIVPGLVQWEADKTELETARARAEKEAAYFRAAAVSAGILPGEEQNRDGGGRYISGSPGSTPGSPTFTIDDVRKGLGAEIGSILDVSARHQALFGKALPIAPTQLIAEAEAQRMNVSLYADKKFGFAQQEAALQKQVAEKHDAEVASKAVEEARRQWSEANGSNPFVNRPSGDGKFVPIRKAQAEGSRPDPLKMTDAARRAATRQQIHKELAEREEAS